MISINDKSACTGCGACYSVCPKGAITLEEDFSGYRYPKVNNQKCINCNLCENVCPEINMVNTENSYNKPKVKAAWNLDDKIRINSTSGGIFSALAEEFISFGGYVVAAEFVDDKSFTIHHTVISDKKDIEKLRQTKYAQSELFDIFNKIKKLLDDNQKVMFVGTPCQSAGLKNYLRKDYDNLFTVDLVCRGVISQKIYKNYLRSVEKHTGSKIEEVQFRNKDLGWNSSTTKLYLDNGSYYRKERTSDEYMVGYLKHNLYLRPCCYECSFKKIPRVSDISLGDYWGFNKYYDTFDYKGVSVVLINSSKGLKIYDMIKDDLFSIDTPLEQIVKENPCLIAPAKKGKYSDFFYSKFEKSDFIDLIHKIDEKDYYKKLNFKEKVYYILKEKIKLWH